MVVRSQSYVFVGNAVRQKFCRREVFFGEHCCTLSNMLSQHVVHCRTLTYINQMFDKVQQPTKVVERTYLSNEENTNFIANSWR